MEDDIETLRAALARAEQERDEAIEDRRTARDDSARAAAMVVTLRAMMPTAEEWQMLRDVSEAIGFEGFGSRYLDELRDAFDAFIARFPAPVATKVGDHG